MKRRQLSDTEIHGILLNALHFAAREYDKLIKTDAVEGMSGKTLACLNAQFADQAGCVRKLADDIENAITVVLET